MECWSVGGRETHLCETVESSFCGHHHSPIPLLHYSITPTLPFSSRPPLLPLPNWLFMDRVRWHDGIPDWNSLMKLMVIDDDEELLSIVTKMLESHGHTVEAYSCAEEGAGKTTATEYDVILLDYRMPEYDGAWFMKNAKLTRKTKVLLMTAFVNREIINKMFALGACGYLIKPFDEQDLLHHLSFFTDKPTA